MEHYKCSECGVGINPSKEIHHQGRGGKLTVFCSPQCENDYFSRNNVPTRRPLLHKELIEALAEIYDILYETEDGYDADKEWDSETTGEVARVIDRIFLRPQEGKEWPIARNAAENCTKGKE